MPISRHRIKKLEKEIERKFKTNHDDLSLIEIIQLENEGKETHLTPNNRWYKILKESFMETTPTPHN